MVTHQWMPDAATRRLLEQIQAAGIPPMCELGPEAARQAMLDGRVNDIDPPPVADVSDHRIAGRGVTLRCASTGPAQRPPAVMARFSTSTAAASLSATSTATTRCAVSFARAAPPRAFCVRAWR